MCFYFANKTTHTVSYLFIFGDIFNYLYYFKKKIVLYYRRSTHRLVSGKENMFIIYTYINMSKTGNKSTLNKPVSCTSV